MGRSPVGNLILDIDGTLIDSLPNGAAYNLSRSPDCISQWGDYIFFRPHLESFLLYAFSRFQNVSIWTAASPEWAETILLGFEPMLRRIKAQLGRSSPLECSCGARSRASKAGVDDIASLSERLRASNQALAASYSCECGLDTSGMFTFVFTKDRCTRKAVQEETSGLYYEYHTKPLRKIWRRTSFRQTGWSAHNTLILEDTPQNCVDNYGNALYIRTFDVMQVRKTDSALLILQAFLDRLRDVADVRSVEKRQWERLCASAAPRPAPLRHAKSAPSGIGLNINNQSQQSQTQEIRHQAQPQHNQEHEGSITTSSSSASLSSSSSVASHNSSQLGNRSGAFQLFVAPFAHNWPWSGVSASSKSQTTGSSSLTTATSSSSGASSSAHTPSSAAQKNSNNYSLGRLMEDVEEIPVHMMMRASSQSSSGSTTDHSGSRSGSGSSSGLSGRPALLKHSATSDSLLTSHSSSSTLRSGTFHGKASQATAVIDELEEADSDLEDSYQRWGSRTQEDLEDEAQNKVSFTKKSLISSNEEDDDTDTESLASEDDDEPSAQDEEPLVSLAQPPRAHRRSFYGAESDDYDSSSFGSYESDASHVVLDVFDYEHHSDHEDERNSCDGESSQITYTTSEGEEERRLKQLSGASLPTKRSREIVEERLDASELLAQQLQKVQSLSSPNSKRTSHDSKESESDGEEQEFGDDDSEASYDDSGDMLLEERDFHVFNAEADLHCCSVAPSAAFSKMSPLSESGLRHSSTNLTTSKNMNITQMAAYLETSGDTTSHSAPHATRHRMPSLTERQSRLKLTSVPLVESPSGSSAHSSASPWASMEASPIEAQPVVGAQRATGKSDASEEIYL